MKGLILIYGIAVGGAVASLVNPAIGVLVYALFSTLRPQAIFSFAGPMEGLSQLVAYPMLAGWVIHGLGTWRFGRARGIVILLLAHFAWCCLSALGANDQIAAWDYVVERSKIVAAFMVGATMLNTERSVKALAWILVVAHGYVGFEMNLQYLLGNNQVALYGFGSMDNNTFAIALVSTVGPAIILSLQAPKLWQRAIGLAAAALTVHTVLLSFSRGGILALVITGVVLVLVLPKRASYLGAIAVTGLVTLSFMGPELRTRFASTFVSAEERDYSAQSRIDLWADCLESMGRRPMFGVGPGNWRRVAFEFGWPPGKEAHSLWMQTGAELGVPGVALLLLFYGVTIRRGLQMLRVKDDPWVASCGAYLVTSLVGFMVASQFVTVVGMEVPYFTVLVGAATLRLRDLHRQEAPAPVPEPAPVWAPPYPGLR